MLETISRSIRSNSSARSIWRKLLKRPAVRLSEYCERQRYRMVWDRQLSIDDANSLISRSLRESRPFLAARIGHTEGRIMGEYLFRSCYFSRTSLKQAHQNAGIFPVDRSTLSRFARVYADSIPHVDLLGFWQTSYQARLLNDKYWQVPLAPLSALEPYLHARPWSEALSGLKVLVVHPFADSILRQYENKRLQLFPNPLVLPSFELEVLRPPQTLAPLTAGFACWIDALDDLCKRSLEREFDVALLGCGAYGLPLGSAIKQSGRRAIHLGGALQILFGIRGRRWEQISPIATLMNEYWTRPLEEETPMNADLVDEGCYW